MIVCRKNLHHAQKFQQQAHNKAVKPGSYVFGNKIWLDNKYIKTKHNQKLEAKFFELFRVLHPIGKQAYKLELPKDGGFTFFTYHYWSKIPLERSRCTKTVYKRTSMRSF